MSLIFISGADRLAPRIMTDYAHFANGCPAIPQGLLVAPSGSFAGDTTGNSDDFDFDYAATCSYGNANGGPDEIHSFQVDSTGVWHFDTSMACWDTTIGIRADSGGGCPGDPVDCDGDSLNDCYYESSIDLFLTAGTDYFMVIDGYGANQFGPYTVNWNLEMVACTSDVACSDGDPCNGTETCNLGSGKCEEGVPPCERAQSCNPDGSCTDPDPCLIFENSPADPVQFSDGPNFEGVLAADDWGFAAASLGRELISYSVVTVGSGNNYTVETSLWPHGLVCTGGVNDGGECDTDADCTPGGTCDDRGFTPGRCSGNGAICQFDVECPSGQSCVGRRRPGHAAIPGTQCVFTGVPPFSFVTLECVPTSGVILPGEGVWTTMRINDSGGAAHPALAGQTSEIGSSTDVIALDNGNNGQSWGRYWFGGGDLANWVGDLCTVPVGACCMPDGPGGGCAYEPEDSCAASGGSFLGFNNAVHQTDCALDCDGDGASDACTIALCSGDPACGDCQLPGRPGHGVPDWCDLNVTMVSVDADGNGIPDECDVAAPLTAPFPHDRRKNRYISFDPNKGVNDDIYVAFKVTLNSLTLGSCSGSGGFCREDRGGDDCNVCSAVGNPCINQAIDCAPSPPQTCVPSGEVCANDAPDAGGSSVGRTWWVGPESPLNNDVHLLVSEPFRKISINWPNPVHVGDCEVVPEAVYAVRAVNVNTAAESDEVLVETTLYGPISSSWWADCVGPLKTFCDGDIRTPECVTDGDCTPPQTCDPAWTMPDGSVNFDDISAMLALVAPGPGSVLPDMTWVDLHGNGSGEPGSQNYDPPNFVANFSDLGQAIFGFQGLPYKGYDPADCPDVGAWP